MCLSWELRTYVSLLFFWSGNAWSSPVEQGKKLRHFLPNRVAKFTFLCLEQGQDFVESAEPSYPNSCRAQPPPPHPPGVTLACRAVVLLTHETPTCWCWYFGPPSPHTHTHTHTHTHKHTHTQRYSRQHIWSNDPETFVVWVSCTAVWSRLPRVAAAASQSIKLEVPTAKAKSQEVSCFNPFTPKFKKYILPTLQKRNVWVMYWELVV